MLKYQISSYTFDFEIIPLQCVLNAHLLEFIDDNNITLLNENWDIISLSDASILIESRSKLLCKSLASKLKFQIS